LSATAIPREDASATTVVFTDDMGDLTGLALVTAAAVIAGAEGAGASAPATNSVGWPAAAVTAALDTPAATGGLKT
jgi:hypothetical protein